MGYFANGTEGDMFEAQWCNRCVHEDDEKGCPVFLAHILYAYEECNSKSNAKVMLDMLIPRKRASNAQCAMFHERPKCVAPRGLR